MRKPHQDGLGLNQPYWYKRVLYAFSGVGCLVVLGGWALYFLTNGDFSLAETTYFALITVSTVGFGEPEQLKHYEGTHLVVTLMISFGVVAAAFFESTMTAMLVQGVVGKAFRKKRMIKKLNKLHEHIIIAGCGRTGKFCVKELVGLGRPFVIVDRDEEMLERLSETYNGELAYVVGDATDDGALLNAGVDTAWGLVASLTEDRDNVFVVLSARTLNPKLHIVSKVLQTENEPKLIKAGADRLVSPHRIGGFRLVSELVRPKTMEFLDGMRADSAEDFRIEDVEIRPKSLLVGKSLRDSPIRGSANALIVAIRETGGTFVHNPPADYVFQAGSHLIVVGQAGGLTQVHQMASSDEGTKSKSKGWFPGAE